MDDKITIDKDTLKAIASDTRLDILKQLDKKKHTLSDLSKSLNLSGPTIKEHLDVLSNAGLVRKEDSLRKWKYYSLTFKGKGLLRPNETRLFLTLLISIIVGLGIFVVLGLFSGMGSAVSRNSNLAYSADNSAISVSENATNVEQELPDNEITVQSSGVNIDAEITESKLRSTVTNSEEETTISGKQTIPADTENTNTNTNYLNQTICF